MKKLITGLTLLSSTMTFAQSSTELEKKLESLSIPDDKVTTVLSEDKLYVLNNRYSSLVNRHELTIAGANNFTADSHLVTQQAAMAYRFHINSKWSLGARYTRYTNKLSSAGQTLFNNRSILPDTDYALNGQELFVNYNTIYGKLRWSENSVVYFDQYLSLGGGKVKLSSGDKNLVLADVGLAFWLGNHGSARIGLKNEFYQQAQLSGTRNIHNGIGYIEFGYLFGTGDRG